MIHKEDRRDRRIREEGGIDRYVSIFSPLLLSLLSVLVKDLPGRDPARAGSRKGGIVGVAQGAPSAPTIALAISPRRASSPLPPPRLRVSLPLGCAREPQQAGSPAESAEAMLGR